MSPKSLFRWLQGSPNALCHTIEEWHNGYHISYGHSLHGIVSQTLLNFTGRQIWCVVADSVSKVLQWADKWHSLIGCPRIQKCHWDEWWFDNIAEDIIQIFSASRIEGIIAWEEHVCEKEEIHNEWCVTDWNMLFLSISILLSNQVQHEHK